ncbi:MAG: ferrochelatase [Polyangiaceae bacterium]|nr:ferrochelatase [Polyangiaceae bacterium]
MLAPVNRDAVLLSCHGTVTDMRDVPAFLSNIRRGRPAPDELVHEVIRRYETIGGSPLMSGSRAQAAALEARLGVPVRVAGRLWHPYPDEVLRELVSSGATRVLSLPLAPQSVAVYHAAVDEAAPRAGAPALVHAPAWGLEPALIDAFVETIDEALGAAGAASCSPNASPIVLSAHSLPVRVIEQGDSYERDFRAMAEVIAERFRSRGHRVEIAFQSQGASQERWLGPDLAEVFGMLAEAGFDTVVVAPIGFLAEHIETLYDLDVEAPTIARNKGLSRFVRAKTVADRPRFVDALEAVARRALAG